MEKVKLKKKLNQRKKQWIIKRKICSIVTQMKIKNKNNRKISIKKKKKTLNNSLATNNKKSKSQIKVCQVKGLVQIKKFSFQINSLYPKNYNQISIFNNKKNRMIHKMNKYRIKNGNKKWNKWYNSNRKMNRIIMKNK